MDCPNLSGCPFPELKATETEEAWKIYYCFSDSMYGYDSCARYKYKNLYEEKPPGELLPDSDF